MGLPLNYQADLSEYKNRTVAPKSRDKDVIKAVKATRPLF